MSEELLLVTSTTASEKQLHNAFISAAYTYFNQLIFIVVNYLPQELIVLDLEFENTAAII